MDLTTFEQLLDTYGADAERWPRSQRTAAEALLDSSADARTMFARAAALETVLDGLTAPVANVAASRNRILARLELSDWFNQFFDWLTGGRWGLRPAAVAMVPLMIGLGLGIAAAPANQDDELATAMSLLAFDLIEDYGNAE